MVVYDEKKMKYVVKYDTPPSKEVIYGSLITYVHDKDTCCLYKYSEGLFDTKIVTKSVKPTVCSGGGGGVVQEYDGKDPCLNLKENGSVCHACESCLVHDRHQLITDRIIRFIDTDILDIPTLTRKCFLLLNPNDLELISSIKFKDGRRTASTKSLEYNNNKGVEYTYYVDSINETGYCPWKALFSLDGSNFHESAKKKGSSRFRITLKLLNGWDFALVQLQCFNTVCVCYASKLQKKKKKYPFLVLVENANKILF
jgi:hypothetical protein